MFLSRQFWAGVEWRTTSQSARFGSSRLRRAWPQGRRSNPPFSTAKKCSRPNNNNKPTWKKVKKVNLLCQSQTLTGETTFDSKNIRKIILKIFSRLAPSQHFPSSGCKASKRLYTANLRADEERLIQAENCTYFYGQTPRAIQVRKLNIFFVISLSSIDSVFVCLQKRHFSLLSSYLEETESETARQIVSMSPKERAELLLEFYQSLELPKVEVVYR